MEQPAVVASQVLDRRAQNARIEDSPATSSVSVSVDDRANLSFFSSSQRFCVYEVGVLVATCSRLPPRFCALRQTLQLFARQSRSPDEADLNLFTRCSPTTALRGYAVKLDLINQQIEKQASLGRCQWYI
jgi:hypothetical protein